MSNFPKKPEQGTLLEFVPFLQVREEKLQKSSLKPKKLSFQLFPDKLLSLGSPSLRDSRLRAMLSPSKVKSHARKHVT